MKLLTRAHMSQRRPHRDLRVIESAGLPVGARAISDFLCNRGYGSGREGSTLQPPDPGRAGIHQEERL